MAKETEAKRKSSNCCCNTYISIMISFKKIPSARSITDSINALALKVLFACRDEKMISEIQPCDRAFNQFINSVCKQWSTVLRTQCDQSENLTQTTSGLCRNPSAAAILLTYVKTASDINSKNNGDKVIHRFLCFVVALDVHTSWEIKISLCVYPLFRKADPIKNPRETL